MKAALFFVLAAFQGAAAVNGDELYFPTVPNSALVAKGLPAILSTPSKCEKKKFKSGCIGLKVSLPFRTEKVLSCQWRKTTKYVKLLTKSRSFRTLWRQLCRAVSLFNLAGYNMRKNNTKNRLLQV